LDNLPEIADFDLHLVTLARRLAMRQA